MASKFSNAQQIDKFEVDLYFKLVEDNGLWAEIMVVSLLDGSENWISSIIGFSLEGTNGTI